MSSQPTPASLAGDIVNLVTLPDIYLRVRDLLDDPSASFEDMAKVVSVDPNLTSRILRIANSAFYGFPAEIESASRAMTMLGTQQIHDFVLATSVTQSFSKIPKELVDMERFWHTSVLCGAHAKVIADYCGILNSEHMFTTGLLSHIGRLVLYLRLPAVMSEVLAESTQHQLPISPIIEQKLGFDDAAVADQLLSAWKLPQNLVQPIREYSRPTNLQGTDISSAIVHTASMITDLRDYHLEPDKLISHFDVTAWSALKLNQELLLDLISDSELLAHEIAAQILPKAS